MQYDDNSGYLREFNEEGKPDARRPLRLAPSVPELIGRPSDEELFETLVLKFIMPSLVIGMKVVHDSLGEGHISRIQSSRRNIYVKFPERGEVLFTCPEAFLKKVLVVK